MRQTPPRRVGFERTAAKVAIELGVGSQELLDAYWFLIERGIDREPRDDM
jgi:hypothetical protein